MINNPKLQSQIRKQTPRKTLQTQFQARMQVQAQTANPSATRGNGFKKPPRNQTVKRRRQSTTTSSSTPNFITMKSQRWIMPNFQKSATRVSLSSLWKTWKPTETTNVVVNDPNGNSPSQLHQDLQDEKVPEVYQFQSQDNRVYSDYITMLPTEDIIAQFHKQPHEIHFGGTDYQHYFNEKYEYSAPYPTEDHARAIKNARLVTPQNITTLNIMANLYESQTRTFIFTPTTNYDFNKDASHNTTTNVNLLLNALASIARAKIHVRGTLILLVSDTRVCEATNGIWDYSQAYAKARGFMVDQKNLPKLCSVEYDPQE